MADHTHGNKPLYGRVLEAAYMADHLDCDWCGIRRCLEAAYMADHRVLAQ